MDDPKRKIKKVLMMLSMSLMCDTEFRGTTASDIRVEEVLMEKREKEDKHNRGTHLQQKFVSLSRLTFLLILVLESNRPLKR